MNAVCRQAREARQAHCDHVYHRPQYLLGIVAGGEEKVRTFVVDDGHLAVVDGVGVAHYQAVFVLAVDLREIINGHDAARDHVGGTAPHQVALQVNRWEGIFADRHAQPHSTRLADLLK